jgi:hypothetical protein
MKIFCGKLLSCLSVCHQLDSWSVFAALTYTLIQNRKRKAPGEITREVEISLARSNDSTYVLFICLSSAQQLKCLRVSKTESYGLSRIFFEMTRQATMPSSKAWLCLADEQHNRLLPVDTTSAESQNIFFTYRHRRPFFDHKKLCIQA